MRYEISGTVMQTVAIDLAPGETVYSQTNTMCWMNDQIDMNTHTGGGFFAGLKRSFAGGSFFVTDFTSRGSGHVAFAPRFPGAVIAAELQTRAIADLPERVLPGGAKKRNSRTCLATEDWEPDFSAAKDSFCKR